MQFHEKLQELRKQKGMTQEELAARLYVSRTAVSKWESGRGYPKIESLKALSRVFSVSLDGRLSSDEVLTVAEAEGKNGKKHLRDLVFGLLDLAMALFFFLPLFGAENEGIFFGVSLLSLGTAPYLRAAYFAAVLFPLALGILTLALQNWENAVFQKSKTNISVAIGIAAVLLFIIGRQPYAAAFAFALLVMKAVLLFKRR